MTFDWIQAGDHVWVQRLVYTHHGLATGANTVVHYQCKQGIYKDGLIGETTFADFLEGATASASVEVRTHATRVFGRVESVQRARSRLGESAYNLIFNNCEHLVTCCIQGEERSTLVTDAAKGFGGALGLQVVGPLPWVPSVALLTIKGISSLFDD